LDTADNTPDLTNTIAVPLSTGARRQSDNAHSLTTTQQTTHADPSDPLRTEARQLDGTQDVTGNTLDTTNTLDTLDTTDFTPDLTNILAVPPPTGARRQSDNSHNLTTTQKTTNADPSDPLRGPESQEVVSPSSAGMTMAASVTLAKALSLFFTPLTPPPRAMLVAQPQSPHPPPPPMDAAASAKECLLCKKIEKGGKGIVCLRSRCRWAHYCSKECQLADWQDHKKVCVKGATVALPLSMAAAVPVKECLVCKKMGVGIACLRSRCRWAHYCSKDCQLVDWRAHKKVCFKGATKKESSKARRRKSQLHLAAAPTTVAVDAGSPTKSRKLRRADILSSARSSWAGCRAHDLNPGTYLKGPSKNATVTSSPTKSQLHLTVSTTTFADGADHCSLATFTPGTLKGPSPKSASITSSPTKSQLHLTAATTTFAAGADHCSLATITPGTLKGPSPKSATVISRLTPPPPSPHHPTHTPHLTIRTLTPILPRTPQHTPLPPFSPLLTIRILTPLLCVLASPPQMPAESSCTPESPILPKNAASPAHAGATRSWNVDHCATTLHPPHPHCSTVPHNPVASHPTLSYHPVAPHHHNQFLYTLTISLLSLLRNLHPPRMGMTPTVSPWDSGRH